MGSLIDFQFDGITVGYHIGESSTARICYGLGYESRLSAAASSSSRLPTASRTPHFAGLNWDIWQTDDMLVQVTIARAFNLTDGFNGLIVLPDNPVTGQPIGAPLVMRYTPAANLGDMDIAGILLMRRDGPIDWFVNFNYNKSHPDPVTTPFGGLLSDPFETPEEHSGSMYYLGARYNFNNDKTMIGLEYNHGSEYWFNFTPAQDDIIAAKTNTRGDVIEAYLHPLDQQELHVPLRLHRLQLRLLRLRLAHRRAQAARRDADPRLPDLRERERLLGGDDRPVLVGNRTPPLCRGGQAGRASSPPRSLLCR